MPRVLCDEYEYRLVRDLLMGYDKRVRPSRNHSEALNVTFGLALAQIIDVVSKERTSSFSVHPAVARQNFIKSKCLECDATILAKTLV